MMVYGKQGWSTGSREHVPMASGYARGVNEAVAISLVPLRIAIDAKLAEAGAFLFGILAALGAGLWSLYRCRTSVECRLSFQGTQLHPRGLRIPRANPRNKVSLEKTPATADLRSGYDPAAHLRANGVRMEAKKRASLAQTEERDMGVAGGHLVLPAKKHELDGPN
jgi:hypothetical protein